MTSGNTKRLYDTVNYSKHHYTNRYRHKPTRVYMCCRYWGTNQTDMFKLALLMKLSGKYDKVEIKNASFGFCIYATKELINTDTTEYRLGETL